MDQTLRLAEPPVVPIKYTIASCSEHSGRYVAENVLVDSPTDQGSRWSGAYQTPNAKQWMLLRTESLCVLKSVKFGKYHKPHPCNMKEFKLYVGESEDNMTEVLHSGLKNDSVPETFSIRHTNRAGLYFPTQYIKIMPLSAHGHSFHTSIWHVALTGIVEEQFVDKVRERHDEFRETVLLRHVLKHLRQRRLLTPYNDILSRSSLRVEHPLVTSLHSALVLQGNWPRVEQLFRDAADAGLFDAYRRACPSRARWSRIRGMDADGDVPCRRGGHAMCIDEERGMIYLFGGWDGQRSLDDFWVYDIAQDMWRMLSPATSRDANGPGPRACHKIAFDNKSGAIYLFGWLGDANVASRPSDARGSAQEGGREGATSPRQTRSPSPPPSATLPDPSTGARVDPASWTEYCSDFYRYHTRGPHAGTWSLISKDTSRCDGPPLIFDHQMVMDSEAQVMYVSGGRIVDGDWESIKYSGLYSYDLRENKWKSLSTSEPPQPNGDMLSRFGHSMVLEPHSQSLLIFAGRRDDRYLGDMYAYHIPTGTATELLANIAYAGGPEASFTQRAAIDPELREIYVSLGVTRGGPGAETIVSDAPEWIYRYERADRPGKWSRIHTPESTTAGDAAAERPQPRYAHQVVYDRREKTLYMHGGNAGLVRFQTSGAPDEGDAGRQGEEEPKEKRLDDFWSMQLVRPASEEIIRKATYEVRQQIFREMCEDRPAVQALAYLQKEVSAVVNTSDAEEAQNFRALLSHLLSRPASPSMVPENPADARQPLHNGTRNETRGERVTSPMDLADEDAEMPDADVTIGPTTIPRGLLITLEQDPDERNHTESPPSPARYRQRMQVFERLLVFINQDAKQPDNDLLNLIDTDEEPL
ncbi:hypothetical protein OBBRIDRAFT_780673 [Obba rivulosa]|uniref:Muskelin N-terminal domain-containing protein n=1 Tax=Obba rivulosa TaxID=1052685 RepID=A0A8E2DID6_9APHY|nr:hypothetical protein OBBRIDRAFT_780673 [Obba rivulosa]